VDFDLEDENEDGIFEPGEHIFIRRIRVKNSGVYNPFELWESLLNLAGGMPSPSRPTRLEIVPSEFIAPVTSNEGRTFIPQIPSGQIVTLRGSIKAKIREPGSPQTDEPSYRNTIAIALKAVMPGLNRELEHFEFESSVEIQYPLELGHVDFLKTVAQGSQNKIAVSVRNKSMKSFGSGQVSPRRTEMRISIPSQVGQLLSKSTVWGNEVVQQVGQVKDHETLKFSHTSRISRSARDHSNGHIKIKFYISKPGAISTGQDILRLTQSIRLKFQISAAHEIDENATVLVVTNCENNDRLRALRSFVEGELGLKICVWNVNLYAGMQAAIVKTEDDDDELKTRNILKEYKGKTVILLGNTFDFFGQKDKSILDLCRGSDIATECVADSDTSFLLLGASTQKSCTSWMRNTVYPIFHPVPNVSNHMVKSNVFKDKAALRVSICQQITGGAPVLDAYKIDVHSQWYRGGPKMSVKWHAKDIRSYLKSSLPQERFWVCPSFPGKDPGFVAISHGLSLGSTVLATEPKSLQEMKGKDVPKLHPFEAYNITSSLPFSLRLGEHNSISPNISAPDPCYSIFYLNLRILTILLKGLLYSTSDETGSPVIASESGDEKDSREGNQVDDKADSSILSGKTMRRSGKVLDGIQFSLEESVVAEIQNFLRDGPLINNINLNRTTPYNEFEVHFPRMSVLVKYISDEPDRPPIRVLDILRYAIASTYPQKKRQVARSIFVPFSQRRRHLCSYLRKKFSALLTSKGFTKDELKKFYSSVQALHSCYVGSKRSIANTILERNSKFTRCSTQQYQLGRQTTQDVVPETDRCTVQEWDARYQELKRENESIEKGLKDARKKRDMMGVTQL